MSSDRADLGIIGGSGLYEMEGFAEVREVAVDTPFGPPSDHFIIGTLEGRRVAFLPRHSRGHRLLPGELDYRANVFAMKLLEEAEVAVSPGRGFGEAGEGYLRLALVENEQRLRQAVRQISRCLRPEKDEG